MCQAIAIWLWATLAWWSGRLGVQARSVESEGLPIRQDETRAAQMRDPTPNSLVVFVLLMLFMLMAPVPVFVLLFAL